MFVLQGGPSAGRTSGLAIIARLECLLYCSNVIIYCILYLLHPVPSPVHDVCFPFRASRRFRSFARTGCTLSYFYYGNKHSISHSCPPYYRFISSKYSDSRFPPGSPPPPPPTYLLLYLRQPYHPPAPSPGPIHGQTIRCAPLWKELYIQILKLLTVYFSSTNV